MQASSHDAPHENPDTRIRTTIGTTTDAAVLEDRLPATDTRSQIVAAADELFYRHGYEHTSFANIADAVRISRGNFYYHFKSKDEILDAVIQYRLSGTRTMLDEWERYDDPADRIKCYIRIVLTNWTTIRDFGCPVGTLCTELTKLDHTAHRQATGVFTMFRNWLVLQFRSLGFTRNADALAMHVLAWSQGVATLGNSFRDQRFVQREVRQICKWLDERIAEQSNAR